MEKATARPLRGDDVRAVLAAVAEQVLATLDVASLSISVWERDRGHLRTLVNAGVLGPGEQALPRDEVYPVDAFPALVNLLVAPHAVLLRPRRRGRRLLRQPRRIAAQRGALWVATLPGGRPLRSDDIPSVVRAANAIARALDAAR
jgi:hypothetical protein